MGLLLFQGHVSLNTGLSQSSHFFGGLDLIQKCHCMCEKLTSYILKENKKGTDTLIGDSALLVQDTELYQLDKRSSQV